METILGIAFCLCLIFFSIGIAYMFNGYRMYLNGIKSIGFVIGLLIGGGLGYYLTHKMGNPIFMIIGTIFPGILLGWFGSWLIMKLFVFYIFFQGMVPGLVLLLIMVVLNLLGTQVGDYVSSDSIIYTTLLLLFSFGYLIPVIIMIVGGIISLFFNRPMGIISSSLSGGILTWLSLAVFTSGLFAALSGMNPTGDPGSLLLGSVPALLVATALTIILLIFGIKHQFDDKSTILLLLKLQNKTPPPPIIDLPVIYPRNE